MEKTTGKRLRHLRGLLGFGDRQNDFAEALGMSQQALSNMERDKGKPSFDSLQKILEAFPSANPFYILTGQGEPLLREEKPSPTPFLPGGEVDKHGSTIFPSGGLAHALGPNFGEDIDLPAGTPRAAPLPKTRQEFIESLLRENDSLRAQAKQACAENDKLYKVIDQLQDTIRTSQEQLSTLLGKPLGSQHAPGNDNNAEPPPRPRAGYRFYDEPVEQECVVRSIFSAPVVREMKTAA
jgi:transcriptional regulator with XRE-family HTH domain